MITFSLVSLGEFMKFIDPRVDFAFKKIFGSENATGILISFLESLMGLQGDKRIKEVTILDPFLAPRLQEMKESILDVRCKDHRGISYIVEMQVRKTRAFLKRIQFNAAKTYANQLADGEDYPKLNQVIAITITDFNLFDQFDHYASNHQTRETITGKSWLQEVVYWFVELSKFNKSAEILDNTLDKWIFFIKTASALENIPPNLQEEPFQHAFEIARKADMGKKELEYYDKACMAITDARGAIELALEEGEKKGEHKGSTSVLLLQIQQKFGTLTDTVRDKVLAADRATLEKWTLRILTSETLDELFWVSGRNDVVVHQKLGQTW